MGAAGGLDACLGQAEMPDLAFGGWNIDQQTGARLPGLNSKPDHIKLVVDGMLSRLNTDRIDLYEAHVAQARTERDARATPRLAEHLDDLARYDTVFLGSPVWGDAMPAPLRSFLATHDLGGKTIAPFITHGGFGIGSLPGTLAELAPEARILAPFVLECDQERRTLDRLSDWLDDAEPQLRL